MDNDDLPGKIIGAAITVHRELGPGLLESTYEKCLIVELIERGLRFERQKEVPVIYKGTLIECGFRVDLLVEDEIVLELKAVDKVHPIYVAQVMTYLKLLKRRLGYLLNFNVGLMRDGIQRIISPCPP